MANALGIPEPSSPRSATPLPPAGDWLVETGRSKVSFSGRASRIAPTVRAQFDAVRGGLHLADDLNGSRVGVCVDVRTVTTGNPVWDELLRTADPFRAGQHPLGPFRQLGRALDGIRVRRDGRPRDRRMQRPR